MRLTPCSLGAGSNGTVIEVACERLLTLVPWADSLNHCSTATERSVLQYDVSTDAAVLFAHRDYDAGDEVFESYGTWLTPSELLLDYGFVDEKNKTNAITVRSEPPADACCGDVVSVFRGYASRGTVPQPRVCGTRFGMVNSITVT